MQMGPQKVKMVAPAPSPAAPPALTQQRWCPLFAISAALLLLLMAMPTTISGCATAGEQFEGAQQQSDMLDLAAKPCKQAYECWRSEPITGDGMPLLMLNKRLDVGGPMYHGGAKCRCRQGQCTFYSPTRRTFFNCQEL